jgi:hypothetical protein
LWRRDISVTYAARNERRDKGNPARNLCSKPVASAHDFFDRIGHKQSSLAPICIIPGRLRSITLFSPNQGPQQLVSL